ncbi:MAG TPA: YncE family protein [Bdellovibrio sp.]|nr:YncE family protein [Bdellovibrio sp.]
MKINIFSLNFLSKFICLLVSTSAMAGPVSEIKEMKNFKLGGEGAWDCLTVDSEAHRLYIARSNRVMVINSENGKLIGEVTGLLGAHGVVLSQETGKGFASSGKTNEVFVFDLKSLKTVNKIKVGENPDIMFFDQANKKVLSLNGKTHDASIIDPATQKVTGTISLPGKPEFAAQGKDGTVFINIEDKNSVVSVDMHKMKVEKSFNLDPCDEPSGLAIDSKTNRLIVGCGNKLALIVDSVSGKVLQKFQVGEHVDGAAFDEKNQLAYIPAADGTLTALEDRGGTFKLFQSVSTRKGSKTLALDTKSGEVFIPAA